ncbi:transglutaminaseTgpA domain-containing protein [Kitasatospora sp. NPDC056138]|uniref:transglutaminase family protein n=1 Tax=Kitasatospora sp. NPDC056138 TaxID=3345724 RepID=UPI0035E10C73
MTTRAKLTLYSALATALTTLCLTPLVKQNTWYLAAFVQIVAVAAVGAGLRRLALSRALVVPLQLLAVLYLLMFLTVAPSMTAGVLPGPQAIDALGTLVADGVSTIRHYTIPAPASDGLRLILIGSVTLIAVLVDALAVTLRRAAAAGLPLLALYSVGTGLNSAGRSWLWFLVAAAGYLLLLFAEGQDRLSRWGRVFRGTGRGGDGTGTLSHNGHQVGLLALVCALILPVFVPHGDLGLIGNGSGAGAGTGTAGRITSLNPVVALTANLNRPDNVEMFSYTTDASNASQMYLRINALDSFDGVEWKYSDQPLQPLQAPLPVPEGLGRGVPTTPVRTDFTISDSLSTDTLPMPYPADTVTVPGRWRYEADARTVVADNGQQSNGLKYRVDSLDVEPSPAQLRTAGPAPADFARRYLTLPQSLPPVVAETARSVTAGKSNAYDRAVALQTWFNSPEFHYSLRVAPATGNDAIVRFLQDKTGFCVHFAATMAAMARSLGIPARVAIGFAPGSSQGNGRYVVHSQDYHAWPELYFAGSGWLRFEPTPSRGNAPSYSQEQAAPAPSATADRPSAAPSASASAAPSASSACSAQQRRAGDCADRNEPVVRAAEPTPWWLGWQALVSLAVLLLVLALLATPMLWRARQRRRRLGAGRHLPGGPSTELTDQQVLAAWEELIDTAWDLGIPPDETRTPRRAVQRIAESGRLDESATAAAGRVALATEQVLYAPATRPQPALGADVRAASAGLRAAAGRRGRARAVLLPPSSARLRWRFQDRAAAGREALHRLVSRLTGPVRARLTRRRR